MSKIQIHGQLIAILHVLIMCTSYHLLPLPFKQSWSVTLYNEHLLGLVLGEQCLKKKQNKMYLVKLIFSSIHFLSTLPTYPAHGTKLMIDKQQSIIFVHTQFLSSFYLSSPNWVLSQSFCFSNFHSYLESTGSIYAIPPVLLR